MTDGTGCLTSSLNVRALVNVSSLFTLYINNHNEPSEPLKSERSADYVSGRLQVSRLCSSADLGDADEEKLQVSGQWLTDLWPTSAECFQPASLFLDLWPNFHKQAQIQMWWRKTANLSSCSAKNTKQQQTKGWVTAGAIYWSHIVIVMWHCVLVMSFNIHDVLLRRFQNKGHIAWA